MTKPAFQLDSDRCICATSVETKKLYHYCLSLRVKVPDAEVSPNNISLTQWVSRKQGDPMLIKGTLSELSPVPALYPVWLAVTRAVIFSALRNSPPAQTVLALPEKITVLKRALIASHTG